MTIKAASAAKAEPERAATSVDWPKNGCGLVAELLEPLELDEPEEDVVPEPEPPLVAEPALPFASAAPEARTQEAVEGEATRVAPVKPHAFEDDDCCE